MLVKVSEATDHVLDWMVAKCLESEGLDSAERFLRDHRIGFTTRYSGTWSQGGPLKEREKIGSSWYGEADGWEVPRWGAWRTDIDDRRVIAGDTELEAVMRCFVISKLGDVIEVPDGLVRA